MTERSDGLLFDLPASASDPQAYRAAAARVAAIRERSRGHSLVDMERALGAELLASTEADRLTETQDREDVPFEFLQARLGARLTVALIGWLMRRHPRVTRSDREGPSAWTNAELGEPLTGLSADDLARLGVTDSPTDDPACLAAFDGFGTAYPDRVRLITQARARYEDGWISKTDDDLRQLRRTALWNGQLAQRDIDAWKAGER
ncbi:hypothetical protein [Rhodococcus sp. NPDC006774]|uniref:hypothetical protein n=1 Tax=Rhodococcus sp. NPDC006774 TaxID=3157186 RepID=UPI00340B5837